MKKKLVIILGLVAMMAAAVLVECGIGTSPSTPQNNGIGTSPSVEVVGQNK